MLIPFMSCSAKIPIYTVFAAAFFDDNKWLVMSCLYLFGMAMGIIVALVLKTTHFKGKPIPFIMELPNYRLPSLKSVVLLMWEKAKDFLQRAFTIIFVATIIIWFLQSFDAKLESCQRQCRQPACHDRAVYSAGICADGFWRLAYFHSADKRVHGKGSRSEHAGGAYEQRHDSCDVFGGLVFHGLGSGAVGIYPAVYALCSGSGDD